MPPAHTSSTAPPPPIPGVRRPGHPPVNPRPTTPSSPPPQRVEVEEQKYGITFSAQTQQGFQFPVTGGRRKRRVQGERSGEEPAESVGIHLLFLAPKASCLMAGLSLGCRDANVPRSCAVKPGVSLTHAPCTRSAQGKAAKRHGKRAAAKACPQRQPLRRQPRPLPRHPLGQHYLPAIRRARRKPALRLK